MTIMYLLFAVENGHSQFAHLFFGQADDMIGQALGGLFAHAGQLGKLVHQFGDGFDLCHEIHPGKNNHQTNGGLNKPP